MHHMFTRHWNEYGIYPLSWTLRQIYSLLKEAWHCGWHTVGAWQTQDPDNQLILLVSEFYYCLFPSFLGGLQIRSCLLNFHQLE